ncbi:4-phosphoerythronate dehydrogenase [Thalassotalea sp. HSM 43]|uniref:4-phosphoerythronate dehydrogenase n=1 Tax=Thalassotalea sp. HSM 43 TaxID=2552945 RepID=UPI001080D735|nr:4-phosphoerythronate dehydrogenase [Thalassotalea sp. HSM 43]QBY05292.1 4-phosphoerythronate dehydrogenase [Thalassotalea sp. HSM 43]
MQIYYDENIPYAAQFFAEFGELHSFAGRDVTAEQLQDADVLLVRSITQVNEQLLCLNNSLKFVGTATIGFDHIDQAYLASRNIPFTNAPGCNAISVAEYVLSAMMVMSERQDFDLSDKRVGILGAGNTGSAVANKLDALGVSYVLHDPIAEEQGDQRSFVSLDEICQCDIITLHVPKTVQGPYPTMHLFDAKRLAGLGESQILINACRGEVIDNQALLTLKQQGKGPHLVLDVWENEPNPLLPLIEFTELATAHIAGYSLEGKARGTEMLYQALSRLVNSEARKTLSDFLPEHAFTASDKVDSSNMLQDTIFRVYDVRRDDKIFRQQLILTTFDYLRKNYPVRREFSALELTAELHDSSEIYRKLGFK